MPYVGRFAGLFCIDSLGCIISDVAVVNFAGQQLDDVFPDLLRCPLPVFFSIKSSWRRSRGVDVFSFLVLLHMELHAPVGHGDLADVRSTIRYRANEEWAGVAL